MHLSDIPNVLQHALHHDEAPAPQETPLPRWVPTTQPTAVPPGVQRVQVLDVEAGVLDHAERPVGVRAHVYVYQCDGDWFGLIERTVDRAADGGQVGRVNGRCEDDVKRQCVERMAAHLHRVWAIAGALSDEDPTGSASDVMARLVRKHLYAPV